MNIQPKYEDVVAQLDAALAREAALREELSQYEPASTGTASKRARWLLNIQDACKYGLPKHLVQRLNNTTKEIQNSIKFGGTKRLRDENESLLQRLTVAERRESEAREELLDLSRKLDVFYSRSHGIKNLSAIEDANDKSKALQQRLTLAEQRVGELKKLLCAVINESPTGFADLKVHLANQVNDALQPAEEGEGS